MIICFKYMVGVVLNHEKSKKKIHKEHQRLGPTKTSSIEKTNVFTVSKDWQKFETSNKIIVLKVLFLPSNGGLEKIRQAYI